MAFSALQAPAYQASVADYLDEDHCSRASGLIQLCHSAQHLFAALAAGLLVTLGRLHAVLLVDTQAGCPANAIVEDGAGGERTASAPTAGCLATPADLISLLSTRRSERRFTSRDVPAELIGELLYAGAQTPSGGNRRAIECLLIRRGAKRDRLMREIASFYRRLATIASNPPVRWIASPLAGHAAGSFLRDRAYRERFLSLVHELEMGEDPLFYDAPVRSPATSSVHIATSNGVFTTGILTCSI